MEVMIVLTPEDPTIYEEGGPLLVRQLIDTNFKFKEILVGMEYGTREGGLHFHIYGICENYSNWSDANRLAMRRKLEKFFNGRININTTSIKSKLKAMAYTIKDGNWVQRNCDWFEVFRAKAIAKPKLAPYKVVLNEWYDKAPGMDVDKLTDELIEIHCNYRIPMDLERMSRMIRTATAISKPADRKFIKERILEKL